MKRHVGQTSASPVGGRPSIYLFTSVLFVCGVVFGALLVQSLSEVQQQELLNSLNRFFVGVTEKDVAALTLPQSLAYQLRLLGLVWVLGLSVIGFPLIFFLIFSKGLTMGFTVGFLVHQLSWKGILFALGSVVPHNLLLVPALIIAAVTGVTFSFSLLRNRFWQQTTPLNVHILRYTGVFILMGGVFVSASLVEVYLTPRFLHWLSPWVL